MRRLTALAAKEDRTPRPPTVALAVALGAACVFVTVALSLVRAPSAENALFHEGPFVILAAPFLRSVFRGRNDARLVVAGFCLWWGVAGARVAHGTLAVAGPSPAAVTCLGVGYLLVALLLVLPPSSRWFRHATGRPFGASTPGR